MQNMNRIWAGAIALVIIVLIAVALMQRPAVPISNTATSTVTTTQSHDGVQATGGFTVGADNATDLDIPDYRTPIQFSTNISADVKAALQKAHDTLAQKLAKDTFDLKSWIDLGTVKKMGGDYKGAEEAWKFVAEAAPNDSLVQNNLGDLYMNFIKDYPKAEKAYVLATKLSPAEANPYRELFMLYSNFYKKNTTAAEDILKKGIVAAPDNVDFHVLLARYYKAAGRSADAKAQYDAAIAAAKRTGQSAVAEQLQTEANQ